MGRFGREQLNTDISSLIYTNTSKLIKGNTLKQRLLNLVESCMNRVDDAALFGLADYSPDVIYKAGMGAFVNKVLKRAKVDNTGAYNPAQWENVITGNTSEIGITAHAGGLQTNAYQLSAKKSRLDNCASDGDSLKAFDAAEDSEMIIDNNTDKIAFVFPKEGQRFSGKTTDEAYQLQPGNRLSAYCYNGEAGLWTI